MSKFELVNAPQDQAGITRPETQKVVQLFFDSKSDALAKGDRVEIRRAFSFFVYDMIRSYIRRKIVQSPINSGSVSGSVL